MAAFLLPSYLQVPGLAGAIAQAQEAEFVCNTTSCVTRMDHLFFVAVCILTSSLQAAGRACTTAQEEGGSLRCSTGSHATPAENGVFFYLQTRQNHCRHSSPDKTDTDRMFSSATETFRFFISQSARSDESEDKREDKRS